VPRLDVCPFNFWQTYTTISAAACGIRLLTKFVVGDETGCTGVTPKFPFSISIRDVPGNNLLETKIYNSYLDGEFSSVVMEPGKSYEITIADGCNRSLTKIINTPPLRKEVRVSVNPIQTMLDSTAIVYFYAYGFPSVGTTFTITGGPAAALSTKKGYTYHEAYVYPKSFAMVVSSDSSMQAAVNNMAPGKYYFNITDSCGNIYSDSCVVGTHEVSNFYIKSAYYTGCSGQAGISYDFLHNTFTTFNVINNATQANVFTLSAFQMQNMPNPNMGVVNNLSATSYTLSLTYYGVGGSLQSLTNVLADSFVVKDTLVILPYQNPRFQTNAVVFCNGSFVLILTADSTKGIPPYRYEIIGGPQLFPPQSSNVFQMGTPGIYTIRLLDSCNNSTTANVTVDSIVFPPINKIGSSCINGSVKLSYGQSPYFSYSWTLPNDTSFNGDTLTISPVTAADTGLYRIRRTTVINGCLNTYDTVYRLQAELKDSTSRTICEGTVVSFGNRVLTQSGIYADTIPTSLCDIISILNLTVLPLKKDSINRQICSGESILFNGNPISTTGVYRDTIATSACDSIAILRLQVNPLKQDSAVVSICPGQQVNFGGRVLSVPGVYRDTLATTSCDSISVLNLLLYPAKRDSAVASNCQNEEFAFGNSMLNQPGIYRDTFATTTCDSISVLNLIVHPLPIVSIVAANNPAVIGTNVQLAAFPSGLDAYNWESTNPLTNSTVYNPQTRANVESWYKMQATDTNGCTTTDSLLLRVIPDTVLLTCNNTPIFIANAFSPNGDGRNDVFRISSLLPTAVRNFTLAIYNRWGEKIFESYSPAIYWDGTYLGKPASVGNYVYMLRFDCEEGRKIFHKGNIVLLK
jgi:gliding motility-associated-like protein